MDRFSVIWESDNVYASSFDIYVSDSTEDWGDPVASVSDNAQRASTVELDEPVAGRYVRLSVTAMHGYPSVSACDFSISLGSDETPADPTENVALGMTGAADSTEAASLGAGNAFDGDTSSKSSRWASAVDATEGEPGGPHWIYVDLRQMRDVKTVRVFWEMRKANGYRIDIASDGADPAADSSDWQTVYENDGRPASTTAPSRWTRCTRLATCASTSSRTPLTTPAAAPRGATSRSTRWRSTAARPPWASATSRT